VEYVTLILFTLSYERTFSSLSVMREFSLLSQLRENFLFSLSYERIFSSLSVKKEISLLSQLRENFLFSLSYDRIQIFICLFLIEKSFPFPQINPKKYSINSYLFRFIPTLIKVT
jgi:hypothetical protein